MIDIAKLLAQTDTHDVQIKLQDDDLPDLPMLTLTVPDVKTRSRLYRQFFKPRVSLGAEDRTMEVAFDHVGYAQAMCEYVTGWENTPTPFSQALVKQLFTRFERLARAFANGLQKIFETVETDAIKASEVLEKN